MSEPSQARFEIELEFVQCLANPFYLNWLASVKLLEDERFLRYLAFLEYWRDPAYAQFLIYPQCLHYLGLLKDAQFRQDIQRIDVARACLDQQYEVWQKT